MNDKTVRSMAVMLAAALWFAGAATAQEAEPSAEKPAAKEAVEKPVKPDVDLITPDMPAVEDVKQPEVKPEPAKAEAAPKPVVEAPKELTPCAKSLAPLADSYKKAAEDMRKWIGEVDAQTAAAAARIETIQGQIEKNEAAITKLKLEGAGAGSAKGRELAKDNKQLWSDLAAARKERAALCSGFAREAAQRARQYQADAAEKLEEIKAQLKSNRDGL